MPLHFGFFLQLLTLIFYLLGTRIFFEMPFLLVVKNGIHSLEDKKQHDSNAQILFLIQLDHRGPMDDTSDF